MSLNSYNGNSAQAQGERACRNKDKSPCRGTATSGRTTAADFELPRSVRNCWNWRQERGYRLEEQDWWIWSWPKEHPEQKTRRPYTCGSWRCEACRKHAGHQLYARLEAAVSRPEYSPDGWVFCVFTLDRNGSRGGRPWPDARDAFRELGRMSERFLKRLRRECERNGWDVPGSAWATVVEQHRSGFPHSNVLIYAPELARALEEETVAREEAGFLGRERTILALPGETLGSGIRGVLGQHAVDVGWGIESTIEAARSAETVASYLVKLVGEVAKVTQLPLGAPHRFRRLRSGKGFLPPVSHGEQTSHSGALVKRERDSQGIYRCRVPRPRDGFGTRQGVVDECIALESWCLRRDEMAIWRTRRGKPRRDTPVPPVSLWLGGVLQREQGPPAEGWDAAIHRARLDAERPKLDMSAGHE